MHPLTVKTKISRFATLRDVYKLCILYIRGFTVEFDLVSLDMTKFDIMIGMDWLSAFRARVDCHRWRVRFRTPERRRFLYVGKGKLALNPPAMRSVLTHL